MALMRTSQIIAFNESPNNSVMAVVDLLVKATPFKLKEDSLRKTVSLDRVFHAKN